MHSAEQVRMTATWLLLGVVLLAAPCAARRAYVDAPKATWEEFKPYVRANIAPYMRGEEFFVMVCTGATIESVVQPFDHALSDFAKILLLHRATTDKRFRRDLKDATESVRDRLASGELTERDDYRMHFWSYLEGGPYVMAIIRSDHERAVRKGRVRCEVCAKNPEFKPAGLREDVASGQNGLGR